MLKGRTGLGAVILEDEDVPSEPIFPSGAVPRLKSAQHGLDFDIRHVGHRPIVDRCFDDDLMTPYAAQFLEEGTHLPALDAVGGLEGREFVRNYAHLPVSATSLRKSQKVCGCL